jgi:hypothetical protein
MRRVRPSSPFSTRWLIVGVLLKIHQFSPRQYDKVQISISSNEVGIFSIEMTTPTLSTESIMGYEQIRMEDLLQAQFDNEQNLLLFEGMASFSINMLIHQINKSTSSHFLEETMLIFRILRLGSIRTLFQGPAHQLVYVYYYLDLACIHAALATHHSTVPQIKRGSTAINGPSVSTSNLTFQNHLAPSLSLYTT